MSLVASRTSTIAQELARILSASSAAAPQLRALPAGASPSRVRAVDGSSVVLADAGEHALVAYRAGSVGLDAGRARPAHVGAPELALLTRATARARVAHELEADGFPAEGIPKLDVSGALDALRTIEEGRAAIRAVEELAEGDLVLIDGALQARPHAPMLERALARARERRVDVVGVCKSTNLTIGAAPALVACQLAARAQGLATWLAPLATPPMVRGATYAACLSRAEPRAFRFDIMSERAPEDVLASIAALCGHPAYPGYPSPLAMAHNAVLINDETRRRMLALLQEAAIDAGADARAWDAAFVDYHDILELGA